MKHWSCVLAVAGVLYLLTMGVMLRRFSYLFDAEELHLPSRTDSHQDEKVLGLHWINQNAPLLQYKPLGFNKTSKLTKENTDGANNDNLQYEPLGFKKALKLTIENTDGVNNDNLQYKTLGFNKAPRLTIENTDGANNDNLQYKTLGFNKAPKLTIENTDGANNGNLQYKPLGFNKAPKLTIEKTDGANNDNLQYKTLGFNKAPKLTIEKTDGVNKDNLQHEPLGFNKTPKLTIENTNGANNDNLSVAESETRFETRNETFHDSDNVIGQEEGGTFSVEVSVGMWELQVKVDGNEVYHVTMELSDVKFMSKGGMYLFVLHPTTGAVMHVSRHRTFEVSGDAEVMAIMRDVQPGKVLVLATMHEGFAQLSKLVEAFLAQQGSRIITDMAMGDRWAWIGTKGGRTWAEGATFSTPKTDHLIRPGSTIHLYANLPRRPENADMCATTFQGNAWAARRAFCERYEGYGSLCNCSAPQDLHRRVPLAMDGVETGIPTVIVASTRPILLNRCLRHLMSAAGSDPQLILVVADGSSDGSLDEVRDLAALYGVKYKAHDAGGSNVTVRIQRHYKFSFTSAFETFPWTRKVIVLEEDLRVSPDFFSYFGQLAPVLDRDPTLYCASAWNDLSNSKSLGDPGVVMRSETMAGLGWLLKRDIYDEVIEKWLRHDQYADWDMWMRLPAQQQGRECLVPEVSRTFHFGLSGAHLTAYFQFTYFSKLPFNQVSNVRLKDLDRMGPESYDRMLKELILGAKHLKGEETNPCDSNLLPLNATMPHVLWFKMNEPIDNYTYTGIIKCLKLWDLDTRGHHKAVWRLKVQGTPLMLVGWPLSPFSVLKPKEISILQRYNPEEELKDDPVYLYSPGPGSAKVDPT
ncbi:protein O-linked-mannose beta-1,2-N-acetylglucosaminyltransferase 1 [Penaeus vannamei]|uniref:protein O-linked-mannose beta-1,2-N-acetylglucosaminyltransferase 1 n=1 Tax=Penaeus vannamei TaxID=6689 RepID=UPI00387FB140